MKPESRRDGGAPDSDVKPLREYRRDGRDLGPTVLRENAPPSTRDWIEPNHGNNHWKDRT